MFGAGKIGQSIVQAAKTITSNTVFAVDVLPERLAMLTRAYPDVIAIDAREADPVAVIKEITGGRGVDIAFEAVGEAKEIEGRVTTVRQAVRSIRGGVAGCASSVWATRGNRSCSRKLIWKEGTIVTSRVSHGEFKDAIEHLAKGCLEADAMITAELPMRRVQDAYEMLEREPRKYLKVLLQTNRTGLSRYSELT